MSLVTHNTGWSWFRITFYIKIEIFSVSSSPISHTSCITGYLAKSEEVKVKSNSKPTPEGVVLHPYSKSHVVNSNRANGKQNNHLHGMFAYSFKKKWEELLRRS